MNVYDPLIGKLDQPVDLGKFMETMGTEGQTIPTEEEKRLASPCRK